MWYCFTPTVSVTALLITEPTKTQMKQHQSDWWCFSRQLRWRPRYLNDGGRRDQTVAGMQRCFLVQLHSQKKRQRVFKEILGKRWWTNKLSVIGLYSLLFCNNLYKKLFFIWIYFKDQKMPLEIVITNSLRNIQNIVE